MKHWHVKSWRVGNLPPPGKGRIALKDGPPLADENGAYSMLIDNGQRVVCYVLCNEDHEGSEPQ